MPFKFTPLAIPEVILVEPKKFLDDRGFFMESYKETDFAKNGIDAYFVQDNHSVSDKGVLRGLHFQCNPNAQGKLVRVATGKIFDVAVDIRRGSPTYGQWVGETLSDENHAMLWVPPGFAHGVCVLEDNTNLLYRVSGGEYNSQDARHIIWNDPEINVKWPTQDPSLSEKDQQGQLLKDVDHNFTY